MNTFSELHKTCVTDKDRAHRKNKWYSPEPTFNELPRISQHGLQVTYCTHSVVFTLLWNVELFLSLMLPDSSVILWTRRLQIFTEQGSFAFNSIKNHFKARLTGGNILLIQSNIYTSYAKQSPISNNDGAIIIIILLFRGSGIFVFFRFTKSVKF